MLGQEKPQDFELIELLIREAAGVSQPGQSTSAQQKVVLNLSKQGFNHILIRSHHIYIR